MKPQQHQPHGQSQSGHIPHGSGHIPHGNGAPSGWNSAPPRQQVVTGVGQQVNSHLGSGPHQPSVGTNRYAQYGQNRVVTNHHCGHPSASTRCAQTNGTGGPIVQQTINAQQFRR